MAISIPHRNFLKFALFMSYFPQIVQGPIARYDKLAVQFKEGHAFDAKRLKYGSQLILWGFMKKLILADLKTSNMPKSIVIPRKSIPFFFLETDSLYFLRSEELICLL